MKFKIKVGDLLEVIAKVKETVDKKKDTAGSGQVFISAYKTEKTQVVYFYSTNMVAEVNDKLTCEVEEAGKSLLDPDQLLAGLAHRNPEDVAEFSLVTTGKGKETVSRLRVKIGKNQFHLAYDLAGTEVMDKRMKAIPFKQEPAYTIPGSRMAEFIKRGICCIPRDNEGVHKFEMTGMRFITTDRGTEAHATDGHVCMIAVVKGEKGPEQMEGVLIPQAALPSLAKLVKKEEEIKVIEGEKNARGAVSRLFFKMGDNTFFGTRLLDGAFPNLVAALKNQTPEHWFTVDRNELKIVLQRAGAFDQENRIVNITITKGFMMIRAKGPVADMEEEVPIEAETLPESFSVLRTINLDYLLNIANTSSLDRLKIGVCDYNKKENATKALVVDDTDEKVETLYAVMPVRQ